MVHEKRPLQCLALRTRFRILLRLSRRISHPPNHDVIPRAPRNQWRASTQDDAKNHTTNHVHSLVKGSLLGFLLQAWIKMFFHSSDGSGDVIVSINASYANSSLLSQALFHSFHPASKLAGNLSKHTGALSSRDSSASILFDMACLNLITSSASFVISFFRRLSVLVLTALFIIFPRRLSFKAFNTLSANSSLGMSAGNSPAGILITSTFVLLSSEAIFFSSISKQQCQLPKLTTFLFTHEPRFQALTRALFGHAHAQAPAMTSYPWAPLSWFQSDHLGF